VPGILLSIASVEPAPLLDGGAPLSVKYTISNLGYTQGTGQISGEFQGVGLRNADGSEYLSLNLAPGESFSGTLVSVSPMVAGSGRVDVRYRDQRSCFKRPRPSGQFVESCVYAINQADFADVHVERSPNLADSDQDGVIDTDEAELLGRFRPYYRFSKEGDDEDKFHPIDALVFVKNSQLYDSRTETDASHLVFDTSHLANQPDAILSASTIGPSSTQQQSSESSYHLNLSNEHRTGEPDWNVIKAQSPGLYGHVLALREDPANPAAITGYKVEYWQLFGFNPVRGEIDCSRYSAHEGDWEGIELVIASDKTAVRKVVHHVHSGDVVFDMSKGQAFDIGNGFQEWRGTEFDRPYTGYIDLHVIGPAGIGRAQNNLVRFFCDAQGCTHPVAYIEYGGHAMWPTEHWAWPWVYNHNGSSEHAYLVETPSNLGEIGAPNETCLSCKLVVGFNGNWGACGSDPPGGPPTKGSWGQP
jgi:hypothetical protein